LGSFLNTPENFKGGKISKFYKHWKTLTNDSALLDIIAHGYSLEFDSPPCALCHRQQIPFNGVEKLIIQSLLGKLLEKEVIELVTNFRPAVVSNIFTRLKGDGTYRLILNLSNLNEHIDKKHFKMETLKSALSLVKQDCYFSKIDLKDAYYSVPIHQNYRSYLCFLWEGKMYQFTCLPNGLSSAPRIFTKLLKPVFAHLRKQGYINCAYIDDVLLQSQTYHECLVHMQETAQLVDEVGLTVHPIKSQFEPTQCIEFVGFLIDSVSMTVRLTDRKIQELIILCTQMLKSPCIKIRDFAKLIGKFVASEPGVQYAPLYYKSLEIQRDAELAMKNGNFDSLMSISDDNKQCMKWWVANLSNSYKPISHGKPDRIIESDSSSSGFGAHDVTHDKEFSGTWTGSDLLQHINYLELKAAYFAIQYFCQNARNEHVQLFLDNTTAIKYLDKMGGRIPSLNNLAKEIWLWCAHRNIWLSVFHIPGKLNVRADALSRQKLSMDMEWMLDQTIFDKLMLEYGQCEVDMFASARNFRLTTYVSYLPDDKALAVNAFSLSWTNIFSYMFPPFSILGKVLQKLEQDEAEAVLVAPLFSTQTWFPKLLQMISGPAFLLPKPQHILKHPSHQMPHRLVKMSLGVFKISGNKCAAKAFQETLPISFCALGGQEQRDNIGVISQSGCHFVNNSRLIRLNPL